MPDISFFCLSCRLVWKVCLPGRRFRGSGCLARSGQNSKPYPMVKELQKWKIEELKNWHLLKNRTVSHVPTSFSFSVWVCRDLRPKFGCHLGFWQFHDMSTLFSCNYTFFFTRTTTFYRYLRVIVKFIFSYYHTIWRPLPPSKANTWPMWGQWPHIYTSSPVLWDFLFCSHIDQIILGVFLRHA